MKILVIEDEKELRNSIVEFLKKNGHDCTETGKFKKGVEKSLQNDFDCILIDVGLPDGSGIDIVDIVKKNKPETSLIVISAKDSVEDKIKGLQIGADDYLTKPFHFAELNARIQSVYRRKNFGGKNELEFDNLVIKLNDKQLLVNGKLVHLTKKEYEILVYLASNPTYVITKEALADAIWGDKAEMATSFDFVYSQIKNLKKKINEAGASDYIKVLYGMGYRFI